MPRPRKREWTIFSPHGLVLLHVAAHADATIREIGQAVGLTERWVRKVVADLGAAGMLRVTKRGVQNHYAVEPAASLRHPTLPHLRLRHLPAGSGSIGGASEQPQEGGRRA